MVDTLNYVTMFIVNNSYFVLGEFGTSQKELLLVSSRRISSLTSGGRQQLLMGVSSCTGPVVNGRSARL